MNLGIKTSTYFQFRSKTKWFGAVAVGSLPTAFSAFGENGLACAGENHCRFSRDLKVSLDTSNYSAQVFGSFYQEKEH
jgi:hypothetical protein